MMSSSANDRPFLSSFRHIPPQESFVQLANLTIQTKNFNGLLPSVTVVGSILFLKEGLILARFLKRQCSRSTPVINEI